MLVSPIPFFETLQLQTPGGVIVPGAPFAKVAEHAATPNRVIQAATAFNEMLGPSRHLSVGADALKARLRQHFGWEEMILRLSQTLAHLRHYGPSAGPRRMLTDAALADSWPAEIVNVKALALYLAARGRIPLAISEQGLLAMLVDTLANPWDSAPEPLPEPKATARFVRCAMLASEVLDRREGRDGVLTLFAPDALLGLGRIREHDLPKCALVRAHELYAELLPPLFPAADKVFTRARGLPIADWIHGAVALATMAIAYIKPGGQHSTRIDFTAPDTRPAAVRARRVAEQLSRSRDEFRRQFATVLARPPINPGLAFRPLRESPLLRLDGGSYVGLHADFLLAAADDGVFFAILDALADSERLKGAFLAATGAAFEKYVERVLSRCSAVWSTELARIPVDDRGRNRCDFGWKIGEDLLLLDAKRFGLASDLLMGDLGLSKRMLEDVGHALQQFAETAEDIRQRGTDAVIPELAGWTPRRIFAAAVSHRPMYAWFSATEQIADRTSLPRAWKDLFAAKPLVWSISELELLEATLPPADGPAVRRPRARRTLDTPRPEGIPPGRRLDGPSRVRILRKARTADSGSN